MQLHLQFYNKVFYSASYHIGWQYLTIKTRLEYHKKKCQNTPKNTDTMTNNKSNTDENASSCQNLEVKQLKNSRCEVVICVSFGDK